MICDGLNVIERYRGLYKGLDALIDWLAEHDPAELPVGSNEIDGARVFANVMAAHTRQPEDAQFEAHKKYMDVQIDLEGTEAFKTIPGKLAWDEQAEDDFLLESADMADAIDGVLGRGRFVIFTIGEPHMPTLVAPGEEAGPVKKICFKVVGDQFWDEV